MKEFKTIEVTVSFDEKSQMVLPLVVTKPKEWSLLEYNQWEEKLPKVDPIAVLECWKEELAELISEHLAAATKNLAEAFMDKRIVCRYGDTIAYVRGNGSVTQYDATLEAYYQDILSSINHNNFSWFRDPQFKREYVYELLMWSTPQQRERDHNYRWSQLLDVLRP